MNKTSAVTPYSARSAHSLLFITKLLKEQERAIPTDLAAALNARGIEVSSI